uniref:Uncharacterized protein n=1 Tax=Anguilla anguilla TaxID=7936 RepID=A0A0E9UK60_ANGAN
MCFILPDRCISIDAAVNA